MPLLAELKRRLEAYYKVDEEAELASVAEALLQRGLADAHSETDDELIEELRDRPLPGVHDKDFDSDFDEMHETDDELPNLYNAREHVEKKMKKDELFNMDDAKWDAMVKKSTEESDRKIMADSKQEIFAECRLKEIDMDEAKWDEVIQEATEESGLGNMKECEDILEDMLHWDKLLPGQWNLCFPLPLVYFTSTTIFNMLV
jgi:small subunit ribosomal protein S35